MHSIKIKPDIEGLEGDPRKRPSNVVGIGINMYLEIPASEIDKHSRPGWRWQPVDVVREYLKTSGTLEEFLTKMKKYAVDSAVTVGITS